MKRLLKIICFSALIMSMAFSVNATTVEEVEFTTEKEGDSISKASSTIEIKTIRLSDLNVTVPLKVVMHVTDTNIICPNNYRITNNSDYSVTVVSAVATAVNGWTITNTEPTDNKQIYMKINGQPIASTNFVPEGGWSIDKPTSSNTPTVLNLPLNVKMLSTVGSATEEKIVDVTYTIKVN